MIYVYVSSECREDAQRHMMLPEVDRLQAKIEREQNTQGLDRHPAPFLKKPFGTKRLVMAELMAGEDLLLCFLRLVPKAEIGDDYDRFFKRVRVPDITSKEMADYLAERRRVPVETKPEPSSEEVSYLVAPISQWDAKEEFVIESPLWVGAIGEFEEDQLLTSVWETLEMLHMQSEEERNGATEVSHGKQPVKILYQSFPEFRSVYLIAPIRTDGSDGIAEKRARELAAKASKFEYDDLVRHGRRSYPNLIVFDRDYWLATQGSSEANLALSPEEINVLQHVNSGERGFPLFINGRPGSGKSTVLQYLFSEYLYFHLKQDVKDIVANPPLYLTYNERLLQNAKNVVEAIFKCDAKKLLEQKQGETFVLDLPGNRQEFNRAFGYFRDFLFDMLPSREHFNPDKYIDFHTFKKIWFEDFLRQPNSQARKLGPEVAWHVVRSYIKGRNRGGGEYFDECAYKELPEKEKTVQPATYELVFDKVWNGWYRRLCDEGCWDDQDLARAVLDQEWIDPGYPAIFCDEAQDFTVLELELIYRLSLYSQRKLNPQWLTRVPFAFAGDPFQTLNPTGFRWESIKANFHNNIAQQLDPAQHHRVEINYIELSFNYRSTQHIVGLCNLIQLKRGLLFALPDLRPQRTWAVEEGAWPSFYLVDDLTCQENLRDQTDLVIIVPCQEGGEEEFIRNDEFLQRIALDSSGAICRNVLSPMRAKGLEFARVVLYKFGDRSVRENLVAQMSKLAEDRAKFGKEGTLPLEYFFNALYVGASRAQKKLIIVDSAAARKEFWSFAEGTAPNMLLSEYKTKEAWQLEDLAGIVPGDNNGWVEDRDDPLSVARRFYDQGLLEKSTYLLQLAQSAFARVDDESGQERCIGAIAEIEGRYRDAGDSYLRLNELDRSIECYWEERHYKGICEVADRDKARFRRNGFVIAAKYSSGKRTVEEALNLVSEIFESFENGAITSLAGEGWSNIFLGVVETLAQQVKSEGRKGKCDVSVRQAVTRLNRLRLELGLEIAPSISLSRLAYSCGNYREAVSVWEASGSKTEPEFVLHCRAEIEGFPKNLKWLAKLGEQEAVIGAYEEAGMPADLADDDALIVFRAYAGIGVLDKVKGLVNKRRSRNFLLSALEALPDSAVLQDVPRVLLASLICSDVKNSYWKEIIDVVGSSKTQSKALRLFLGKDAEKQAANAYLIKAFARSEELSNAKGEQQRVVTEYLDGWFDQDIEKLMPALSIREAGAAVERANRLVSALKFYESVYKQAKWGKEMSDFAKARWVVCKYKQADADSRADRREQLMKEAELREKEWRIKRSTEEFPQLDELEDSFSVVLPATAEKPKVEEEKELVPVGAAISTDGKNSEDGAKGEETGEKLRRKAKLAGPEKAGTKQTANGKSGAVDGKSSEEESASTFKGTVQFSFSLGERKFEGTVVHARRRIELRFNDGALVMVKFKERVVSSEDIDITEQNGIWAIGNHGLDVRFRGSDGFTFAELRNSDGSTILASAG